MSNLLHGVMCGRCVFFKDCMRGGLTKDKSSKTCFYDRPRFIPRRQPTADDTLKEVKHAQDS